LRRKVKGAAVDESALRLEAFVVLFFQMLKSVIMLSDMLLTPSTNY